MLLYHATHRTNQDSIGREGVSTAYSDGAVQAVWGCQWSMRHWACLHCIRRHGGSVEDVVVLEIDTQDVPVHRFRGGLFYSLHTWHPSQIRWVLTFEELSMSPTEEG
jgi:hypothetical protein